MHVMEVRVGKIITLLFLLSGTAVAGEGASFDKTDTFWVLFSTMCVLFMLPGLAIFYVGMVRAKNVLSTMLYSIVPLFVIGILWVFFGHSLAFAPGGNAIIGGTDYLLFNSKILSDLHGSIPEAVFALFQGMFAIITCALLSGSIVERVKFSSYVIFIAIWSMVVYVPLAHWVWSPDGFLAQLGALDFAGGIVVHFSSAVAAFVFIKELGPRKGFPGAKFIPHNLMLTVLGTGLLWFGWFGFNAGSALAMNEVAVLAFSNTFIAGAAGGLSWTFIEWRNGKPTALGVSSGIVAGLASVTNAAGFVSPHIAFLIGLVGGVICYYAIFMKFRFHYDDSLDVLGIHGVGGVWGAVATGLFATVGGTGLFAGNPKQLLVQIAALAVTLVFVYAMSLGILKVMKAFSSIRVSDEDETIGLDATQHGETAYN